MAKDDFQKRLGQHIKKVRLSKGISAAQLSRLTEIDKPHISRLESGGTNPTATTIKAICDALDISFEELFKGFKK